MASTKEPIEENTKDTTPNELSNGSLTTLPSESANDSLTTPTETTTAAAIIDKTGSSGTDAVPPAPKKWKWWGMPSFSFPILKILQGIFLILMIGQSLPGAEKSFWPFNKNSATTVDASSANKQAGMTPFYVEQRSELYGHERQFPTEPENNGFKGLFWLLLGDQPPALTLPVNTGIPAQQHIVMKHLNQQYEAYRYSVRSVTDSKVLAGQEFARTSFRRALEKVLGRLTDESDRQRLTRVEEHFLEEAGQLVERHATLRASLVMGGTENATTVDSCQNTTEPLVEFFVSQQQQQIQPTQQCPLDGENSTHYDDDGIIPIKKEQRWSENYNETLKQMDATHNELSKTIATFITHIQKSLPSGPAHAIKDALMGHLTAYGSTTFVLDLQQSPLRTLYSQSSSRPRKRVFVLHFVGDVFAFGVTTLRQEVTAILHSAEATDEVLVVLQSSGGTVTGYGLIAGQLLRIKEAGLRLTVAVEQVAASGGYLAACVGHTIVCSPFALVGSIGVVREELNFHERLKREGIENVEITAGEYKHVLSPLKEVKAEDLQKVQEELEEVHTLFKKFVSDHRPSLDMDVVATGEVWFGTKAVELGLCDAIRSADDVLTDFVHRGYDVYEVKYHEPMPGLLSKFFDTASMSGKDGTGFMHWFFQKIVLRLKDELLGNSGDVGRIMAR